MVTAGADWIGNVVGQHNVNSTVSFAGVSLGTTFPLVNFDGQDAPSSWGVNGGAYLQCCAGGMTVINNRMLGLVGVNNWMWTKGLHTFNFGVQLRRTYQNTIDCNFCSGTFNFSQRTTSTPDSNDPNFGSYGSSFASFLLGQADAGERIFANEVKLRNRAFAFYVQDQFKLNMRITLNLGLRYDILVPFTEGTTTSYLRIARLPTRVRAAYPARPPSLETAQGALESAARMSIGRTISHALDCPSNSTPRQCSKPVSS